MRIVKDILSRLHIYVLWLVVSTVFWGWVFMQLTDTVPAKKVTVYIDAPCDDRALTLALEEDLPDGIKMIKVHPFSYALFDDGELENADIFLVSGEKAGDYVNSYLPLSEELCRGRPVWEYGGQDYGLEAGGELLNYVNFSPEAGGTVYLFFGANSRHAAALSGRGDDAALHVAEHLLAPRRDGAAGG